MVRKTTSLEGARDFFAGELKVVLQKNHVTAKKESIEYLISLMVSHIESDRFFSQDAGGKNQNVVLADLYADFLNSDSHKRQLALKRLGDVCLLVSGFFSDSLHRKPAGIGYYFGMGGTAYQELAKLQFLKVSKDVFSELSEKFKPFSDVLGELSERGGLQSNSDLLKLYERWLFTGNERLKSVLTEHGIAVPLKVDTKTKH